MTMLTAELLRQMADGFGKMAAMGGATLSPHQLRNAAVILIRAADDVDTLGGAMAGVRGDVMELRDIVGQRAAGIVAPVWADDIIAGCDVIIDGLGEAIKSAGGTVVSPGEAGPAPLPEGVVSFEAWRRRQGGAA